MNNRIEIASQLRPCTVSFEDSGPTRALFHRWEQWFDTVPGGVTINSPTPGQVGNARGIVELEDGQVRTVDPLIIRFLDSPFGEYDFTENKDE